MKSTAFSIILSRQIKQKLARFILASSGIAVGVWAITLTTGLSQGASSTLINAINTQPAAREVSISKQKEAKKVNIFDFNTSLNLVSFNNADLQKLQQKYPEISSYNPESSIELAILKPGKTFDCSQVALPKDKTDIRTQDQISADIEKYNENCISNINTSIRDVNLFISGNKAKIVGDITTLTDTQIISCFSCLNGEIKDAFGAKEPKDLIGKQIMVSLTSGPNMLELGKSTELQIGGRDQGEKELEKIQAKTEITTPNQKMMTIAAVYDDRDAGFFGFFDTNFVVPTSEVSRAFTLANPNKNQAFYGYFSYTVTIDSIKNVDKFIKKVEGTEYIAASPTLSIIQGITAFFNGLTVVFAIFGLIAVIASLFGIINVMLISVLERQKEIGILKALGATNNAIFRLFFIESAFLGVLGWITGTVIAVLTGYGISAIVNALLRSYPEVAQTLSGFGVTSFAPYFPWWLLLGTLLLSVLSTTISGFVPSARAARQNPAEVMRSE